MIIMRIYLEKNKDNENYNRIQSNIVNNKKWWRKKYRFPNKNDIF